MYNISAECRSRDNYIRKQYVCFFCDFFKFCHFIFNFPQFLVCIQGNSESNSEFNKQCKGLVLFPSDVTGADYRFGFSHLCKLEIIALRPHIANNYTTIKHFTSVMEQQSMSDLKIRTLWYIFNCMIRWGSAKHLLSIPCCRYPGSGYSSGCTNLSQCWRMRSCYTLICEEWYTISSQKDCIKTFLPNSLVGWIGQSVLNAAASPFSLFAGQTSARPAVPCGILHLFNVAENCFPSYSAHWATYDPAAFSMFCARILRPVFPESFEQNF